MQDKVPIASAQRFSQDFYRQFLAHGVVDLAVNQARLARYEAQDFAWSVPVVYMRVADGRLLATDRLLTALRLMAASDAYNPLGADADYMPSVVVHFPGNRVPPELARGERRRPLPTRETLGAILATLGDGAEGRSARQRSEHGLVALVGEPGMGKSMQLRRIARAVVARSLGESDLGARVAPALVDVSEAGVAHGLDSVAGWVAALESALRPYWPDLDAGELPRMLSSARAPRFWLFVDGSDTLSDGDRTRVWNGLLRFWKRYPRAACLVAYDLPVEDLETLPFADSFVLQPIPELELRRYLLALGEVGEALYAALRRVQLTEIATYPWVLARLLAAAEREQYPGSMTQVVRGLLADSLQEIPLEWGVRRDAERSLSALAWRILASGQSMLTVDEVFETLVEVRASRGYNVETLFRQLIEQGLLTMVGHSLARFTRSIIRAYCAVQLLAESAELEKIVDDIAATLGRRTRLYWWETTLILLASEIDDPSWLVRAILYGIEIGDGEQVFLCARILQDVGLKRIDPKLLAYVLGALCSRLDPARETRGWRRARVAEALGQIGHPDALPYLVRSACSLVRTRADGMPTYDQNSVRLAATLALQRIAAPPFTDVGRWEPALPAVLQAWYDGDVEGLAGLLAQGVGGAVAVAAFALGDLGTPVAADILIQAFLYPGSTEEERLALSTALTLLDADTVTQRVVLPIVDETFAREAGLAADVQADRGRLLNHAIYIAGRVGCLDERVRIALRSCVADCTDLHRKGLAITALGRLYDGSQKARFEAIAAGDLADVALPAEATPDQVTALRRQALEALRDIGDGATLARFRVCPDAWGPELESAFYEVSEAILWREGIP